MLFSNSLLNKTDYFFARNYVRLCGEREGCLSAFMFHGLFRESECCSQDLDIQQGITLKHFETFIDHFLSQGYDFVGQADILKGLNPDKKHAFITFDDGYFNNTHAVGILKKFKVPAVFFVSTNHVLEQKAFWWDVIARKRLKQGFSWSKIRQEQGEQKLKKTEDVERYVIEQFGSDALKPVGDLDRPLTVAELKDLSQQPFVEIGNHTCHHAILPNYSAAEIRNEIARAQDDLEKITGTRPVAIAYPNGDFSDDAVTAAKELGLKIGITTWQGKNYLPLKGDELFFLKRFTLWGSERFIDECERTRSDFQFKSSLKKLLGKVKR